MGYKIDKIDDDRKTNKVVIQPEHFIKGMGGKDLLEDQNNLSLNEDSKDC